MDRTAIRERLGELAAKAWDAYDAAASLKRVEGAMPILFFGDLKAYLDSPLRVLTVGLNPSRHEFPEDDKFKRFPLMRGNDDRNPERYLDALSHYYSDKEACPYSVWFSAYERLLQGLGASYYGGAPLTALQTDICSPVPTDPTWSKLGAARQKTLKDKGVPLWHHLLKVLEPDLVLMSVGKSHRSSIEFKPVDDDFGLETIHEFDKKGNGDLRPQPYEIESRLHKIGGKPSRFVFGRPAQKPFSLLSDKQKQELGGLIKERYLQPN